MNEKPFNEEGTGARSTAAAAVERPEDDNRESTVGEFAATKAESEAAAERIEEDNGLSELLKAAEEVMNTPPPRDPAEIDAKTTEYERLAARLEKLPDISESRLTRLERIKKGEVTITAADYERLQKEKISPILLGQHKKVSEMLGKTRTINRNDNDFVQMVNRLSDAEYEVRDAIEKTVLGAATEEFQTRVAEVRAKVDGHYKKRANELEAAVTELKNDPEVMKRHGERIREKEEKARQEELARCEEVLNGTILVVQTLSDRQRHAIDRIEQIAGSIKGQSPAEIRKKLIDSILLGEKGRIVNPAEVVPWKQIAAIKYVPEIKQLQSRYNFSAHTTGSDIEQLTTSLGVKEDVRAKAVKTLRQIQSVLDNDRILQEIFGREWEHARGRDGGKRQRKTEFFEAFDRREKNDKEGKTKRLKEARAEAEKRAAEVNSEIQELLKKGGVEGAVSGAALREIDPQKRYYSDAPGAVLFNAKKSKKGNPYLEVVETAGAATKLFKKGTAYSQIVQIPQGFRILFTAKENLEKQLAAARES